LKLIFPELAPEIHLADDRLLQISEILRKKVEDNKLAKHIEIEAKIGTFINNMAKGSELNHLS
jgi:hypothetical protein